MAEVVVASSSASDSGGNFIADRPSSRHSNGDTFELYVPVWRLGGVSDADGFATLAAAAVAIAAR